MIGRMIGLSAATMTALLATGCAGSGRPALPQTTATELCINAQVEHDGWFVTFWKDGGEACMGLGPGGSYTTRYTLSPRFNLVAGKGWRTGSPGRTVSYRADRFDAGANSYLTLYGWSVDPLVEYYVVDDWGSRFKPPGRGAQVLGIVETDGGTYEIYRTVREQKPSIRGTQTFDQFWSVRTERRPVGSDATITFANHVAAWREVGLDLGRMDYQVLATEGFGSDGASAIAIEPAAD